MSTTAIGSGTGCRRRAPLYVPGHEPPAPAPPGVTAIDGGARDLGEPATELVPDSFQALYPIFLMRKVDPAQKAAIWSRYQGRWVRWSGKIVSLTRDGFTVRAIPDTVTFDVSVMVDAASRPALARYHPGDRVTFVGRLSSFDDIFRTFYLTQGAVVGRAGAR